MRIYIMDTIELPKESGGATHKWELARNLSKLGHEIHVMAYEGMKVRGAILHQMKDRWKYKFDFIFKILHLYKILNVTKMHNPDIIYTRNVSFALLGLLIRKVKKTKLVLELNGLFSEDWKSEKKSYLDIRNFIWSWLEIFVAKKVDAIITVSTGIRDILIEKGIDRDKITVISNGANTDVFKPISNNVTIEGLRIKYGIRNGDNVIIFVGNMMRWHGVDCLVKSAPLILKKIPNVKFLIVGTGQIKNELIDLVEDMELYKYFVFTGTVPYEQVPLFINMADLCVAPFIRARNERMGLSPIKIYEYLACGKPVVASDIKGIGNLLRNSNAGIAVTPENPNELADAIVKLLKDEKLRKQMGKRGRNVIVNKYSWYHTARRTVKVFENILGR